MAKERRRSCVCGIYVYILYVIYMCSAYIYGLDIYKLYPDGGAMGPRGDQGKISGHSL